MTQPAQAFAPGSPAGGIVQKALGSIFGGAVGGGLGMTESASSGASSGDAAQGGSSLGGSMNINYGNGVTQGDGATPWGLAALVAGGVALIVKRFA